MRLVTYDRGGARRLGAWVGKTVVDLPDAVGHPAFPSSMESLVARAGGTLLEAARAALSQPGVEEFAVTEPRLVAPIVPSAVWHVRSAPEASRPRDDVDILDSEIEVAAIVGRPGRRHAVLGSESIFGYALVDWWPAGLGPSIVTTDEVDPADSRLMITVDGHPWMTARLDLKTVTGAIAAAAARQELLPGAAFVFPALAVPFSRSRRRVRPGAVVDAAGEGPAALGRVAGSD
jgi:hypothetical protein